MEKKKLNKIKNILVIAFIAIYLICTYFTLRGGIFRMSRIRRTICSKFLDKY